LKGDWSDEVDEIEIGGAITHIRRFTVKARCLFSEQRRRSNKCREIATTVRDRIEKTLLDLSFTGVSTSDEYTSRAILSEEIAGEMLQAGGPGSYDYHIKVRFLFYYENRSISMTAAEKSYVGLAKQTAAGNSGHHRR